MVHYIFLEYHLHSSVLSLPNQLKAMTRSQTSSLPNAPRLFLLCSAMFLGTANGHGYISVPAARNGNDNQLGGRSGSDPTGCTAAGKTVTPYNGLKTTYTAGSIIDIKARITAHHGGKFEFRLQDVGSNVNPDGSKWNSITPLQVLSFSPHEVDTTHNRLQCPGCKASEPCAPHATSSVSAKDSVWGGGSNKRDDSNSKFSWENMVWGSSRDSKPSSGFTLNSVFGGNRKLRQSSQPRHLQSRRLLQGSSAAGTCAQIPLGGSTAVPEYTIRVQLPGDVTCEHCVMQWHWWTGNDCWPDYVATTCNGGEEF
jgi:hypothetical protein